MECRYPTASSTVSAGRLSVRRRSRKLSSDSNGSNSAYGSPTQSCGLIRNTNQNCAFLADDEDGIQRRPTVLLVNPLHSSRRHPSGPLFPLQPASLEPVSVAHADDVFVHRSSNTALHDPVGHTGSVLLSPINLTLPLETSFLSTCGPNQSSESLIHSSTPDAAATRNRSILPQCFNFLFVGRPHRLPSSAFMMVSPELGPQSVRSESNYSTSSMATISAVSRCSGNSVDSGHSSLISCINTTGKFTHKWPRPQSLRTLSTKDTDSTRTDPLTQTKAVSIEEGHGFQTEICEKWTLQKWCLLVSVIIVLAYGIACLACTIMAWFRIWSQADVMFTADTDVLILATLTGSLLIFAALIGMTGVLLDSRPLLAVYVIFLWPGLISMVAVGYVTYKRSTFALDHKLDLAWSQWYTPEGRLLIQDALHCCGFYDALHEAIPSKRCYPRTPLPGCKGKLYRFEKAQLGIIWTATFSLVPLHILNIMVALLCANHITKTFGDGIIPKKYRLSTIDLKADAEKISSYREGEHATRSLHGGFNHD